MGQPEDEAYRQTRENIQVALKELGSDVALEEINDGNDIQEFGVFSTPAVVTQKYHVKSAGKVADKNVVKEWVKALSE